ncbi:MAG: type II toxin-antitoxin system VapC family toxin [Opitutaceae bacterium]|nr:type II toxin-antitoxin system VapC family toxin [Opitutaceae bacterium]
MKASRVDYLVDAGPLVGAFWSTDQWHEWSRATLSSVGTRVFTTESVFAEAAHHLKAHPPALFQLLAALESGLIEFLPIQPLDSGRAAEIIHAYPDRGDWGDASLIILSERHPKARLITTDRRDFTVYRRRDGKAVPCILPSS